MALGKRRGKNRQHGEESREQKMKGLPDFRIENTVEPKT